jgi:hypothetical protein
VNKEYPIPFTQIVKQSEQTVGVNNYIHPSSGANNYKETYCTPKGDVNSAIDAFESINKSNISIVSNFFSCSTQPDLVSCQRGEIFERYMEKRFQGTFVISSTNWITNKEQCF